MHTVHFAPEGTALVTPLCGDWAGMDTEWTGDPAGVTCRACREALRARASAGPLAPHGPRP